MDSFNITEVTDGVQIEVATGAVLFSRTTTYYDLTLTVSYGVDHEVTRTEHWSMR